MGATAELAAFSVGLPSEEVPERARQVAMQSLMDSIGVALVASAAGSTRIISDFVRRESARGPSVVIGQGFRAAPSMAALANGTFIHALDYDDMSAVAGHPSAAALPSALAVAEAVGATGRELLDAMVIGFEVVSRFGLACDNTGDSGPYARGYHGTSIYGVFGATAAAARLLGLTAEAARYAFGIAASEASGVRANFGTMAKPYHSGECNRAGVVAAYLAQAGFDANSDAIEARFGWGDAIASGNYAVDKLTEGLGQRFVVEDSVAIKRLPCCGGTHAGIFAIQQLMSEEELDAEDIESLEVHVPRQLAENLHYPFPWPATGLEAKFSLAFTAAEAWQSKSITLDSFSENRVKELEWVRSKVVVRAEEGHVPVVVTARLRDGRTLSRERSLTAWDPMSMDETEEKFLANLRRSRPNRGEEYDPMLKCVRQVDQLSDLGELTEFLI